MDFEKEHGEPVYTKLLNEYILELQAAIDICSVSVRDVQEKIMEQSDAASLVEFIVRDSWPARILVGCKPLLDSMPTALRNPDNDIDVENSMPYNQAMETLYHVVRSAKWTAFKWLFAAPLDGEDVTDGVVVSCEFGLFVLEMTCRVKDVVVFAATLHMNLMSTRCQHQNDNRDRIYGFVTNALSYFKKSLAKLNRLVGESNAFEAESSRFKLLNPVARVRQWASNASSFAARPVDMSLDVLSISLAKSAEDCRKVCPALDATMGKDCSLDYELASKVMAPNKESVIDAHNMVCQYPQLHDRLRHHAGGFAEAASAPYHRSSCCNEQS